MNQEFTPLTPEEEVDRARTAQQVLQNEIFIEACQNIEGALAMQRARVPLSETDMHTRLILTEQLWLQLRDYIQQVAQTGQFAQAELDRREVEQNSFLKRILSGALRV